jgi:hypothetical protein
MWSNRRVFLMGSVAAAALAAAICAEQDCDTRGFPIAELQRRLKDLGAYLPNA